MSKGTAVALVILVLTVIMLVAGEAGYAAVFLVQPSLFLCLPRNPWLTMVVCPCSAATWIGAAVVGADCDEPGPST
jgi:hypothetical protein